MAKVNSDAYDVLPAHPRRRPQESLTGYLTRVGETNGIETVTALAFVLFPHYQRQVVYAMADLPPVTLDTLSMGTLCPTPDLLTATFYHVARKFGRTTSPTWLGRFLSGMLAPALRYCPGCLTDDGYRRLIWRFVTVYGCAEHGCRLLDRCGHCGEDIPFLASPLRVCGCPSCGRDLRDCAAPRSDADEATLAALRTRDARALIAPHPCEGMERPATAMGAALASARRECGMGRDEMARRLGISELAVRALEAPYAPGDGKPGSDARPRIHRFAPLSRYMAYIDAIGADVCAILSRIPPMPAATAATPIM